MNLDEIRDRPLPDTGEFVLGWDGTTPYMGRVRAVQGSTAMVERGKTGRLLAAPRRSLQRARPLSGPTHGP